MFNRLFSFRPFGKGNLPYFQFIYTNAAENAANKISKVTIHKSPTWGGSTDLAIEFIANPTGQELKELLIQQNPIVRRSGNNVGVYSYRLAPHEELRNIILFLRQNDAIDDNSRDQLLSDLNYPVFSEEVHAEILTIAAHDLAEAKKKAREKNHYEYQGALWVLAEHLKEKNMYQDALEIYQEIPLENKYYKEAQLVMREILQRVLIAYNEDNIELTDEELRKYRENMLCLSLDGEDKDTRFSSQLFCELSGGGLRHEFPEIKKDAATFVAIAREMAQINKENRELKAELARYKRPRSPVLFKGNENDVSGAPQNSELKNK